MRLALLTLSFAICLLSHAQKQPGEMAQKWVDSVYKSLLPDERIGQLIVTRLSSMDVKTKKITFLYDQVTDLVKKYNIGGVCVFQGSPVLQANYLNSLQAMAKTPILVSIDAEWGVGMRIIDSVLPLPKQMMLGAVKDAGIVYKYGQVVAEQCKRMGIQMNYAPVLDVNNNPNNPVINDRSFGEDKYKVALFGTQYMRGMQESGVMACAKHFPGHGDVAVDSHYDLPVIYKSPQQLDSLELYPFRHVFGEGISSVMIAHLYIPSIDNRKNRPSSLSSKNINGLMRTSIGYDGLTITDGLEMQGVKKFFPDGESSVESIIAGNDLLCLPDNIPLVIQKIKEAIRQKKLSWNDIERHCRKVLMAKFQYGLTALTPIQTDHLTADLNKDIPAMRQLVAENAITLLSNKDSGFFPLSPSVNQGSVAYVAVGTNAENAIIRKMKSDYNAGIFYVDFSKKNAAEVNELLDKIVLGYKKIVIGIHSINRAPANNFGISKDAVSFVNTLQQRARTITYLFGNAYAAKNWCNAKNLVVCYEDDSIVHHTAARMLSGELPYKGALPVTVCENYQFGAGIAAIKMGFPSIAATEAGFDTSKLVAVDSIIKDAISKKAMPGCAIMVLKNGKAVLEKAYGHYSYEKKNPVTTESVYDLASLTKICATTLAVMRLTDEGNISLKKKLQDYLPETTGTNKADITIEQLLLHEAGLVPFIPFYKETLDEKLIPQKKVYRASYDSEYSNRVARKFYSNKSVPDTFYHRILQSDTAKSGRYVYSDNSFIFLAKLVETVSGEQLNEYVNKHFYQPMSLPSLCFRAHQTVMPNLLAPSEREPVFRMQELKGDVHDPGAAIMGGVAGHAGLFGNARDVSALMQMLLNGGEWNGKHYITKETIELFTTYKSDSSRRGYGFDKPYRNNDTIAEPYPARSASARTFGHTGFTGTCAWADPEHQLVFVFLSNRLYPYGNSLFNKMNIRPKLLEALYQAMVKDEKNRK